MEHNVKIGDKFILLGMRSSKIGITTSKVKVINKTTFKLDKGQTVKLPTYQTDRFYFFKKYHNGEVSCDIRKNHKFSPHSVYRYTKEEYERTKRQILDAMKEEEARDKRNKEYEKQVESYLSLEEDLKKILHEKLQEKWLEDMCKTCKHNVDGFCVQVHRGSGEKNPPLREAMEWSSCHWEKR